MKRLDKDEREILAGEYVLGTLGGRVRARVADVLSRDAELAAAVAEWEVRLGSLATRLAPIPPDPWLWQAIERRLGFDAPESTRKVPWGLRVWQGIAFASVAAVAVLGVRLYTAEPEVREVPVQVEVPKPVPVERMAAVLTGEQARSAWIVTGPVRGDRIRVRALEPEPLPSGRAYELWLLPEGRNPISLGLVPEEGERTIEPPPELRDLLRPGVPLAVSLEPAGGSPTGQPTGPVLYQGHSRLL